MPYLFNGKELDTETGLYYYGARYYDPKVSIFVNVDPLVEKTMQSYAYANNNPVMLIDPTGKEPEDWVKRKNEDGSTSWVWREDIKARYQAIEAGYIDYAQPGYVYMAQKSFNERAPVRLGDNGEWHFMGFIEQLTYTRYHENPYLHIIDHSKIPTIRRTPDTNSPEYAMSTPSGRLALAGLEGLKGATTGIATEYALAKIGLATKLSWSGSSIASDGINGLGVQTSFKSIPVTNTVSYDISLSSKIDLFHNFPLSFDNYIINNGSWAQRIKDGANWYEISGSINGTKGTYQIGITHGNKIFHRNFIPNKKNNIMKLNSKENSSLIEFINPRKISNEEPISILMGVHITTVLFNSFEEITIELSDLEELIKNLDLLYSNKLKILYFQHNDDYLKIKFENDNGEIFIKGFLMDYTYSNSVNFCFEVSPINILYFKEKLEKKINEL